jgi:hypothetical protein
MFFAKENMKNSLFFRVLNPAIIAIAIATAYGQQAPSQPRKQGAKASKKDVLYSPGQIEIPQDQSVDYYIDNVYKLRVEGKDQAEVDKAWKAYLKNNVSTGYCFDLYTLPVADRPTGDKGRVLDLGGKGQLVNIVEIAPGKSTEWHNFGFNGEPLFYILAGQGLTEYYSDLPPSLGGMPYKKYTWGKSALFALPPDHRIRHTNTGTTPVRMLQVVGYGVNLFPYVAEDRLRAVENDAETDEARAKMMASGGMNVTPFFADLRQLKLAVREERADSSGFFDVASTAGHRTHPNVHVSQLFRDKTFAHKHDGRPMFVILQGYGHDLWSDANNLEEFRAAVAAGKAHVANYKEGAICGIPAGPHWHQHFGEDPNIRLRYLAIVPRRQIAPQEK